MPISISAAKKIDAGIIRNKDARDKTIEKKYVRDHCGTKSFPKCIQILKEKFSSDKKYEETVKDKANSFRKKLNAALVCLGFVLFIFLGIGQAFILMPLIPVVLIIVNYFFVWINGFF